MKQHLLSRRAFLAVSIRPCLHTLRHPAYFVVDKADIELGVFGSLLDCLNSLFRTRLVHELDDCAFFAHRDINTENFPKRAVLSPQPLVAEELKVGDLVDVDFRRGRGLRFWWALVRRFRRLRPRRAGIRREPAFCLYLHLDRLTGGRNPPGRYLGCRYCERGDGSSRSGGGSKWCLGHRTECKLQHGRQRRCSVPALSA
ncbi:hypothetical protein C8F01DRAFT_1105894 [Mycena amicta]|nr:hypothetical protein C8F01DRAFT_1105894 [Mycena amicta]